MSSMWNVDVDLLTLLLNFLITFPCCRRFLVSYYSATFSLALPFFSSSTYSCESLADKHVGNWSKLYFSVSLLIKSMIISPWFPKRKKQDSSICFDESQTIFLLNWKVMWVESHKHVRKVIWIQIRTRGSASKRVGKKERRSVATKECT